MTARRGLLAAAIALAGGCSGATRAEVEPACPDAVHPPLPSAGFAAAVARPGGPRIVAIGSSSTAGAGASFPWRAYPARLEAQLRRELGVPVTVMNRGVGGEEADNMIGRLGRDVLAESPDLVIWQIGANAALRRMDPDRFRAFVEQGLEVFRIARVDVVLMDNQRAPRIAARGGNRAFDAILAEKAADRPGVALFSRGAVMDGLAARGLGTEALIAADGLHHNDMGYACIAGALARALVAGLPDPPGGPRRAD
jgi:lysophospholipase L1-like esterase